MKSVHRLSFSDHSARGMHRQTPVIEPNAPFANGNPRAEGLRLPEQPLNAKEKFMNAESRYTDAAPSPDLFEETLRFLLMRYARNPSPSTAGQIASCLDGLLAHPEFKPAPDDRCTYRRMRSYWRLVERLG